MPHFNQHRTVASPTLRKRWDWSGFTIVEVMMASVILVVGFIGLIEAVAVTSNMMDHARRQTVATQILNSKIEDLRTASWSTISGLPTASTAVPIDPQFWPNWVGTAQYVVNSVVTYNGGWYRCTTANTGQLPTNTTYWTATTSGSTSDIVTVNGASFAVSRTVNSTNPVTNIREVTFTVTWVTATSRRDSLTGFGNQLTFTFQRSNSAWFGKYGLNLSYQRS